MLLKSHLQRFWWLNLMRGIVALIISILIIGWPQTTRGFFVNFLAIYWLSSGLLSLRGGVSTRQHKGLWLTDGLLDIIIGVGLLLRPIYKDYLTPELATRGFGLLAFLVGLTHVVSAYQSLDQPHEQVLAMFLLGFLETGLGMLLILSDTLEPSTKWLAGGWAFTGGVLLIIQSLQIHRTVIS